MSPSYPEQLFQPFVHDGKVDARLVKVLGIVDGGQYTGAFEKVLDPEEGARFDFYMEAASGLRIFFVLKLSETEFGSCPDDERHHERLANYYRPHLHGHVDAKWLEPAAFCAHHEVLRKLSYLGRYGDSGVVFIFPRANEALKTGEGAIKQIVSKSLAPRVAILYLEYLVERILEAVAGDEALTRHYLAFRRRYVGL